MLSKQAAQELFDLANKLPEKLPTSHIAFMGELSETNPAFFVGYIDLISKLYLSLERYSSYLTKFYIYQKEIGKSNELVDYSLGKLNKYIEYLNEQVEIELNKINEYEIKINDKKKLFLKNSSEIEQLLSTKRSLTQKIDAIEKKIKENNEFLGIYRKHNKEHPQAEEFSQYAKSGLLKITAYQNELLDIGEQLKDKNSKKENIEEMLVNIIHQYNLRKKEHEDELGKIRHRIDKTQTMVLQVEKVGLGNEEDGEKILDNISNLSELKGFFSSFQDWVLKYYDDLKADVEFVENTAGVDLLQTEIGMSPSNEILIEKNKNKIDELIDEIEFHNEKTLVIELHNLIASDIPDTYGYGERRLYMDYVVYSQKHRLLENRLSQYMIMYILNYPDSFYLALNSVDFLTEALIIKKQVIPVSKSNLKDIFSIKDEVYEKVDIDCGTSNKYIQEISLSDLKLIDSMIENSIYKLENMSNDVSTEFHNSVKQYNELMKSLVDMEADHEKKLKKDLDNFGCLLMDFCDKYMGTKDNLEEVQKKLEFLSKLGVIIFDGKAKVSDNEQEFIVEGKVIKLENDDSIDIDDTSEIQPEIEISIDLSKLKEAVNCDSEYFGDVVKELLKYIQSHIDSVNDNAMIFKSDMTKIFKDLCDEYYGINAETLTGKTHSKELFFESDESYNNIEMKKTNIKEQVKKITCLSSLINTNDLKEATQHIGEYVGEQNQLKASKKILKVKEAHKAIEKLRTKLFEYIGSRSDESQQFKPDKSSTGRMLGLISRISPEFARFKYGKAVIIRDFIPEDISSMTLDDINRFYQVLTVMHNDIKERAKEEHQSKGDIGKYLNSFEKSLKKIFPNIGAKTLRCSIPDRTVEPAQPPVEENTDTEKDQNSPYQPQASL